MQEIFGFFEAQPRIPTPVGSCLLVPRRLNEQHLCIKLFMPCGRQASTLVVVRSSPHKSTALSMIGKEKDMPHWLCLFGPKHIELTGRTPTNTLRAGHCERSLSEILPFQSFHSREAARTGRVATSLRNVTDSNY